LQQDQLALACGAHALVLKVVLKVRSGVIAAAMVDG